MKDDNKGNYVFGESTEYSIWDFFAQAHEFVYSQRDRLITPIAACSLERVIENFFDEDARCHRKGE